MQLVCWYLYAWVCHSLYQGMKQAKHDKHTSHVDELLTCSPYTGVIAVLVELFHIIEFNQNRIYKKGYVGHEETTLNFFESHVLQYHYHDFGSIVRGLSRRPVLGGRLITVTSEGRVGYFLNERRFSVESSLQGISSNSLLSKRTTSSVLNRRWSCRGKYAASARAGLREANAQR